MTRRQAEQLIETNKQTDSSYAHVLLHGMARIYNHTPWPVRAERLEKFRQKWPELISACLRSCSQAGARRLNGGRHND